MTLKPLVDLITEFEGLRLESYKCPAGIWTIGYGSTGNDIGPGLVWTEAQCLERCEKDSLFAIEQAKRLCPALVGNQLAAVADFVYNLGAGRLATSTLRKKINAGDMVGAEAEFSRWVFTRGVKMPGLVRRREAERLLFANQEH